MSFIEIDNLKKTFRNGYVETTVLKGVTTHIEQGEVCGIFGPSGSGKSTLLNIIGGLEPFDSGKAVVDGTDLNNLDDKQRVEYRRSTLGFIFQFYNLIPDLTIRDNIRTSQYLSSDPLDIDELIETVGLTEQQDRYPSAVSGGQQQRCAIAGALSKNPKILLCDEPTGALDYKSSKIVLGLLEKVNKKYGTTILIVTHNLAVKQMVDHIIQIHDGRTAEDYINEEKKPVEKIEW